MKIKSSTVSSTVKVKAKGWNWYPLVLIFIWAGYHGFLGLAIQQSICNKIDISFTIIFFLMFSFLGYSVYKVNYSKIRTQIIYIMNNTVKLANLLGLPIKTGSFINFNIKNNFARYEFNAVGSKNRGRIILMKHEDKTIYLAIKLLNSKETSVLINNPVTVSKALRELESEGKI